MDLRLGKSLQCQRKQFKQVVAIEGRFAAGIYDFLGVARQQPNDLAGPREQP
jgi:hypothetical protein